MYSESFTLALQVSKWTLFRQLDNHIRQCLLGFLQYGFNKVVAQQVTNRYEVINILSGLTLHD